MNQPAAMTAPDGIEVVATAPESPDRPPLLVLDTVTEYLDGEGIGSGPLAWERVGEGQANITYRLRRHGADVVLRRGPRPPFAPSTHDMAREARIQQVLGRHGVPVPEILAVCEDESLIGAPFYLMRWLDGQVITNSPPPQLSSREDRRATSLELVRGLAGLHGVDSANPDVAALGRPDGYLERQLRRFASLWDTNSTRNLPLAESIWRWLLDNRPATQATTVVHGDYRLGNVMLRRDAPATLLAILDWEMATLGDPLADLGYLLVTYSEPGENQLPVRLSPVTRRTGYLRRSELISEYAATSPLDLDVLPWYQVMALWKSAVFCEAIYTRWLRGERPEDTTFAPHLERGVPELLGAAEQARYG